MITQPITDPSPVWGRIRPYLTDQHGGLATEGHFFGVFDGPDMAGAFLVKRWNDHCYELHGGVHPDWWGRGAEVCDQMGRSLFVGTPCMKVVVAIPEFNRLMRKCVLECGMREEGVVKKAFMKWSRMHDLHLYGMTKGELPCPRQ